MVLILGGKTFSAAAVLDWDVGRYSKPLDEHKNKVWQLKYIENNHCCWSKAKHNTLLYFLLPIDATLWPQKWQLNVIAKLCSIICMERCGMKLRGGNDSFKCACLSRYNEASSLDGSYKEKLL